MKVYRVISSEQANAQRNSIMIAQNNRSDAIAVLLVLLLALISECFSRTRKYARAKSYATGFRNHGINDREKRRPGNHFGCLQHSWFLSLDRSLAHASECLSLCMSILWRMEGGRMVHSRCNRCAHKSCQSKSSRLAQFSLWLVQMELDSNDSRFTFLVAVTHFRRMSQFLFIDCWALFIALIHQHRNRSVRPARLRLTAKRTRCNRNYWSDVLGWNLRLETFRKYQLREIEMFACYGWLQYAFECYNYGLAMVPSELAWYNRWVKVHKISENYPTYYIWRARKRASAFLSYMTQFIDFHLLYTTFHSSEGAHGAQTKVHRAIDIASMPFPTPTEKSDESMKNILAVQFRCATHARFQNFANKKTRK